MTQGVRGTSRPGRRAFKDRDDDARVKPKAAAAGSVVGAFAELVV